MKARRAFRWLGGAWLAIALLAALPPLFIESACRVSPQHAGVDRPASLGIADAGYRRPLTNSYLSYPEWHIVYAYQDLAAILARQDEYGFDYMASIGGFWTSLCGVNRIASAQGGGPLDEKIMLYVIGLSFTGELALKGAYETTLGHVFAWLRGPERTKEDLFARHVAEDYAGFLQQTPWYEYPFATRIRQLWQEVPYTQSNPLRAGERRVALTMEWAAKAAYARLIRIAAGWAPADLRIGSVVQGLDASDLAADPRITVVHVLRGNLSLIETPRYGAFSRIVAGLADRGRQLIEIAGNHAVLVTALLPSNARIDLQGVTEIFTQPVQSQPGWRRVGLDASVPQLTELIRELKSRKAVFEHVYDY